MDSFLIEKQRTRRSWLVALGYVGSRTCPPAETNDSRNWAVSLLRLPLALGRPLS